jgi:hypothetical protein
MREAMPELGLPRRTVFVGYAQGRARLPDGSWRNSTKAEYEFDPVLRAKTEGKGDREALEYMKFGRQRASTGARLGVIRQLVGIPVTFSQEDISRPLVFSRIVQNTDYILGTKEGRVMAVAAAIGITGQLYGAQPAVPAIEEEPTTFQLKDAEDQSTQEADWEDAPLAPSSEAGNLLVVLEEYLASGLFGEKPAGEIKAVLDRNETDPIILRDMVDRCKAYEAKATRRAS